jgi:hypothetical protein
MPDHLAMIRKNRSSTSRAPHARSWRMTWPPTKLASTMQAHLLSILTHNPKTYPGLYHRPIGRDPNYMQWQHEQSMFRARREPTTYCHMAHIPDWTTPKSKFISNR